LGLIGVSSLYMMHLSRLLCFLSCALICRGQLAQQFYLPLDPGKGNNASNNIAVDSLGNSYVLTSIGDIRVTKVDPQGHIVYSRQFGGSADDWGTAITADSTGNVWVAGFTASSDFPTTLPPVAPLTQPAASANPLFAAKLNPAGEIQYSTLIPYSSLRVQALATDSAGALFMTGTASGAHFSTAGAFQENPVGSANAFVLKLSPAGDRLVWSTALGGTQSVCMAENNCPLSTPFSQLIPETEGAAAIFVDSSGSVYLAGITNDVDFPVTAGAFQTACTCHNLETNGFVSKLSADGSHLIYSTYLGGSNRASVQALSVNAAGEVFVTGPSLFPTAGAPDSPGFVARLSADGTKLLYSTNLLDSGVVRAVKGLAVNSDQSVIVALLNSTRGGFLVGFDATGSTRQYKATLANTQGDWGFAATASGRFTLSGSSGIITGFQSDGSQTPSVYALTDSATVTARGHLAPGELVTFYGARLGPEPGVVSSPVGGFLPTISGGTKVLFDGVPAPVLYSSSGQLNVVVPYEVFGRKQTDVQVISAAGISAYSYEVVPADPVIVQDDNTNTLAFNQDGSRNWASNPAEPGSTVTILATGAGILVNPEGVTGQITTALSQTELPVSIVFPIPDSPVYAQVTYAGPVPTVVSGMIQVNFVVPRGGSFYLKVGDAISQLGFIAVR
jgi:uncharacterized protein (TIGR03437 family)